MSSCPTPPLALATRSETKIGRCIVTSAESMPAESGYAGRIICRLPEKGGAHPAMLLAFWLRLREESLSGDRGLFSTRLPRTKPPKATRSDERDDQPEPAPEMRIRTPAITGVPPRDIPPRRRSGVAICVSSFRSCRGEPIAARRRAKPASDGVRGCRNRVKPSERVCGVVTRQSWTMRFDGRARSEVGTRGFCGTIRRERDLCGVFVRRMNGRCAAHSPTRLPYRAGTS